MCSRLCLELRHLYCYHVYNHRTYTYGSQVTDIFCSQRLVLRHTGFKFCLELRHMCSLENEGKGASNNFRRLLPNG